MVSIELRTLTPLWTGNIERDSSYAKETSIIGSLRWWYEAVVNRFGGNSCDPTTSPCIFNYKEYKNSGEIEKGLKDVCDVCRLFGCTEYGRRFRLEVDRLESVPLFFVSHQNVYLSNGNWLSRIFDGKRHKSNRDTFFSFDKKMLFSPDSFEIKINILYNERDICSTLYFLIWFVSEYGGLGAKTQNGFGQVKMINPNSEFLEKGKEEIEAKIKNNQEEQGKIAFNLNDFFSIEFEIKDKNPYYGVGREIGDPQGFDYRKHFIPCAFDVRYKMRSKNPFTKMGEDWGMRPFFFREFGKNREAREKAKLLLGDGTKRTSSRIFVSHLFRINTDENYRIRVWGFVPESIEKKERIIELVKNYISDEKTFYGAKTKKEYREKEVFS